jgi:hypothetical protein
MNSFSIWHWMVILVVLVILLSPAVIGIMVMGIQRSVAIRHEPSGLLDIPSVRLLRADLPRRDFDRITAYNTEHTDVRSISGYHVVSLQQTVYGSPTDDWLGFGRYVTQRYSGENAPQDSCVNEAPARQRASDAYARTFTDASAPVSDASTFASSGILVGNAVRSGSTWSAQASASRAAPFCPCGAANAVIRAPSSGSTAPAPPVRGPPLRRSGQRCAVARSPRH